MATRWVAALLFAIVCILGLAQARNIKICVASDFTQRCAPNQSEEVNEETLIADYIEEKKPEGGYELGRPGNGLTALRGTDSFQQVCQPYDEDENFVYPFFWKRKLRRVAASGCDDEALEAAKKVSEVEIDLPTQVFEKLVDLGYHNKPKFLNLYQVIMNDARHAMAAAEDKLPNAIYKLDKAYDAALKLFKKVVDIRKFERTCNGKSGDYEDVFSDVSTCGGTGIQDPGKAELTPDVVKQIYDGDKTVNLRVLLTFAYNYAKGGLGQFMDSVEQKQATHACRNAQTAPYSMDIFNARKDFKECAYSKWSDPKPTMTLMKTMQQSKSSKVKTRGYSQQSTPAQLFHERTKLAAFDAKYPDGKISDEEFDCMYSAEITACQLEKTKQEAHCRSMTEVSLFVAQHPGQGVDHWASKRPIACEAWNWLKTKVEDHTQTWMRHIEEACESEQGWTLQTLPYLTSLKRHVCDESLLPACKQHVKDSDPQLKVKAGTDWLTVPATNKYGFDFRRHAKRMGLSVLTGPSGSTQAILTTAQWLKFTATELQWLRLALIAWMVPFEDHSFYEISLALEDVDVPFFAPAMTNGWLTVFENSVPDGAGSVAAKGVIKTGYGGCFPSQVVSAAHVAWRHGKLTGANTQKPVSSTCDLIEDETGDFVDMPDLNMTDTPLVFRGSRDAPAVQQLFFNMFGALNGIDGIYRNVRRISEFGLTTSEIKGLAALAATYPSSLSSLRPASTQTDGTAQNELTRAAVLYAAIHAAEYAIRRKPGTEICGGKNISVAATKLLEQYKKPATNKYSMVRFYHADSMSNTRKDSVSMTSGMPAAKVGGSIVDSGAQTLLGGGYYISSWAEPAYGEYISLYESDVQTLPMSSYANAGGKTRALYVSAATQWAAPEYVAIDRDAGLLPYRDRIPYYTREDHCGHSADDTEPEKIKYRFRDWAEVILDGLLIDFGMIVYDRLNAFNEMKYIWPDDTQGTLSVLNADLATFRGKAAGKLMACNMWKYYNRGTAKGKAYAAEYVHCPDAGDCVSLNRWTKEETILVAVADPTADLPADNDPSLAGKSRVVQFDSCSSLAAYDGTIENTLAKVTDGKCTRADCSFFFFIEVDAKLGQHQMNQLACCQANHPSHLPKHFQPDNYQGNAPAPNPVTRMFAQRKSGRGHGIMQPAH